MGVPSTYTDDLPDLLIKTLSSGKSLTVFCRDIGIHTDTAYEWRDRYPEFAEALKRGRSFQLAAWEDKLQDYMTDKTVNAPLVKWYMTNVFKWSDHQQQTVAVNVTESSKKVADANNEYDKSY